MTIEEQIREIVVKQLSVEPMKVTLKATVKEDLGADSLEATDLMIAIESTFDIEIPDDEAIQLSTIEDVVHCVEEKVKAKSSGVSERAQ